MFFSFLQDCLNLVTEFSIVILRLDTWSEMNPFLYQSSFKYDTTFYSQVEIVRIIFFHLIFTLVTLKNKAKRFCTVKWHSIIDIFFLSEMGILPTCDKYVKRFYCPLLYARYHCDVPSVGHVVKRCFV